MSSLCRVYGKTNLKTRSCRSAINLIHKMDFDVVRNMATKNGEDKYAKKPECMKVTCDPTIQRADDKHPESRTTRADQACSYAACIPPPPRVKLSCADMPRPCCVQKKKRKQFVPIGACNKPQSLMPPCMDVKADPCPKSAMVNCPTARIPPCCKKIFVRPVCDKPKPPFPSYSECFTPVKDTRKTECDCLLKQKDVCSN